MATKKFLVDIDLNKNQLLNAVVQNLATAPSGAVQGQVYFNTADGNFYVYDGSSWVDLTSQGVGGTDLSYTSSPTNGVVVSSTGNNATLPIANGTNAGLMSPGDFNKLTGVESNADVTDTANVTAAGALMDSEVTNLAQVKAFDSSDYATAAQGAKADSAQQPPSEGAFANGDKTKLDGIEASADVTDAANVNAAGAVMESDTTVANMQFVLDEDTMASNSATKLATQQSIKAYVDSKNAGQLVYQGGYNASTNTPNLDSTPIGIKRGDTFTVTANGAFFTEDVQVGDLIIAEIDNPTTLADFTVVNKNIADIVDASETAKGIIEIATQTEVNTGTDTLRAVTPATLQAKLGVTASLKNALRFTQTIGDGLATTIAVTHNIGEQFVVAQVFNASTNEQVECEVILTSSTQTTFNFNTAPATNQYRVIIIG